MLYLMTIKENCQHTTLSPALLTEEWSSATVCKCVSSVLDQKYTIRYLLLDAVTTFPFELAAI